MLIKWEILENRFNSVSKTHIHDLKLQLYNINKTSTFQVYFDTIKEITYKLVVVGAPLIEDDLVFHALHGLPLKFDPLQIALGARSGDLIFEELITIVNGEEMLKNRSNHGNFDLGSSDVFRTVPKT